VFAIGYDPTMRATMGTIAAAALLWTGCAGNGGAPSATAPAGWSQRSENGRTAWHDSTGRQAYVTQSQSYDGGEKDLATQITLSTALEHARLLRSVPFAPCPGEAGLQTFTKDGRTIEIAFTVWNGNATTVRYERPSNQADDPAAIDAMKRSVCSSVM
jgi:hypothetical protein